MRGPPACEGIVFKLISSKYRSGRSKTWLKTKCFTEGSFVIIGTARDRKTKAPLALLARAESQGLAYAGSAFIAFSGAERNELSARLQMSKLERSPIPKLRIPDAQWVQPQMMGASVILREASTFGTLQSEECGDYHQRPRRGSPPNRSADPGQDFLVGKVKWGA